MLRTWEKGPLLMATQLLEIEDDVILRENAKETARVSCDLRSLQSLRLDQLTPDQIRTIAASGDFTTLDYRNREVDMRMRTFRAFIKEAAPLVSAMRDIMRPIRGSHKRTRVIIDGVDQEVIWGEYCLKVYGVGHDWVNRMLKGEHTQDPPEIDIDDPEQAESNEGVEQTTEPKLSKKDLTIVALQKKNDDLMEQVEELVYKLSHPETPEITSAPDAIVASAVAEPEAQESEEPDIDGDGWGLALDYFEPITKPLSFASELDRLIRACKMQEHVKTVMTEEA
jgi:hypothetical protein